MKFFRRKKQQDQEAAVDAATRNDPPPVASTTTAESETPYHRQEDDVEEQQQQQPTQQKSSSDEILTKIPGWVPKLPSKEQIKESVSKLKPQNEKQKKTYIIVGSAIIVTILLFSMFASSDTGSQMLSNTPINWVGVPKAHSVAFIGNLNFVLNDLPRLMEVISEGAVTQDSCLHPKGNLLNILKTGNGMYAKWSTNMAMISNDDDSYNNIYDYGACSVPQLLLGQDNDISFRNQYGKYYDDGTNPCFEDQNYLYYEANTASAYASDPWEYVVMTDHAKRMAFDYSRQDALLALNYTYAPILNKVGTRPVIVQPHSFWSDSANMTGLTDLPTFTYLTMEGAQAYKDLLDEQLSTKAKIAPVGNAFLAVYEYDSNLYDSLFLSGDGTHPSPKGTLLYSLTIFATIYGSMPRRNAIIFDNMQNLFANARRLQYYDTSDFPTTSEAKTLYKLAKRVAVNGYKPSSLKKVNTN